MQLKPVQTSGVTVYAVFRRGARMSHLSGRRGACGSTAACGPAYVPQLLSAAAVVGGRRRSRSRSGREEPWLLPCYCASFGVSQVSLSLMVNVGHAGCKSSSSYMHSDGRTNMSFTMGRKG
jgi:hypothetical protein